MDLPPPYAVRKPKQTTTSGVVLYILASASRSSLLGTLGRPGWSTSTTYEGEGEQVCDVCQWLPCTVMDEQTKLNVQVIDTTLYSLQTYMYQLKVGALPVNSFTCLGQSPRSTSHHKQFWLPIPPPKWAHLLVYKINLHSPYHLLPLQEAVGQELPSS